MNELVWFGAAMVPFLLINSYFSKTNPNRPLLNEFCAITAFGIGALASYYAGTGQMDHTTNLVWGLSVLFL